MFHISLESLLRPAPCYWVHVLAANVNYWRILFLPTSNSTQADTVVNAGGVQPFEWIAACLEPSWVHSGAGLFWQIAKVPNFGSSSKSAAED